MEKELSIPIGSLDAELKRLGSFGDFIKIDVQGYELEVLCGGVEALSQSIGCELEVSFIEIIKTNHFSQKLTSGCAPEAFFWQTSKDSGGAVQLHLSKSSGVAPWLMETPST